MKRYLALLVLTAGCAAPPSHPFPEERVCGDTETLVRVVDGECVAAIPGRKWYYADPNELDYDDYTPVGSVMNDDYTGESGSHAKKKPKPTTKPKLTPKKRP